MGLLDLLSTFFDAFEIGRKTTTDVKTNKPKERNYDFDDGIKVPSSKSEYKKSKQTNKQSLKKDEDDLQL